MIYIFLLGLVLKSAFDSQQTAALFNTRRNNIFLEDKDKMKKYVYIRNDVDSNLTPSSFMYYDGCKVHRFLHNKFTMFYSFWAHNNLTFTDKVDIFKELSVWLYGYNITLNANFIDEIDSAWCVTMYNYEFHFD